MNKYIYKVKFVFKFLYITTKSYELNFGKQQFQQQKKFIANKYFEK